MTRSETPSVPKPDKEARRIREMFGSIAPRYDLLNHLLSMNTDKAWRAVAVRESLRPGIGSVLDLACGTGDLALELKEALPAECTLVGADFARPMLEKALHKDLRGAVGWVEADGLRLPFSDNQFDLVTIAFGLRNMESLSGALGEILRVLKPGGGLTILEFSRPTNPLVRWVYYPYFLYVLPALGALLSQRSAYLYLPFSVLHFPSRRELAQEMVRTGFQRVRHCGLTFGIAAIHCGQKP